MRSVCALKAGRAPISEFTSCKSAAGVIQCLSHLLPHFPPSFSHSLSLSLSLWQETLIALQKHQCSSTLTQYHQHPHRSLHHLKRQQEVSWQDTNHFGHPEVELVIVPQYHPKCVCSIEYQKLSGARSWCWMSGQIRNLVYLLWSDSSWF